jgi:hypothetical protein
MIGHGQPDESTGQTPEIRVPSPQSAIIAIAINFTLVANPRYVAFQRTRWQKKPVPAGSDLDGDSRLDFGYITNDRGSTSYV